MLMSYIYIYIYTFVYIHNMYSGGWKRAIVGVPWRGSVSACLARGDSLVKSTFTAKELGRLSLLRHHGTPMMAHNPPSPPLDACLVSKPAKSIN